MSDVSGYDFSNVFNLDQFIQSYATTGFQATNFEEGVNIIKEMLTKRKEKMGENLFSDMEFPAKNNCTVFLSFTSNMVSCGVRDIIKYLVKEKYVDVLVTTAGGVEEDFIKCFAPTTIGSFTLAGRELREKELNRIGNLLIPTENYRLFEDWLHPILQEMHQLQDNNGTNWTPSSMVRLLGGRINDESSIYYWAYRNDIPVYCPALVDGSIGDILFCHSMRNPGLRLDTIEDLRAINLTAMHSRNTGMIIIGGGVSKHHTCNANLMRNGADYAVYINTGVEYDGSDSGASPDEAISWGKIRRDARSVKIFGDASIIFPLLVAACFRNGKN